MNDDSILKILSKTTPVIIAIIFVALIALAILLLNTDEEKIYEIGKDICRHKDYNFGTYTFSDCASGARYINPKVFKEN